MNISLTPELEELISKKVESGMYHSASEVIREGLRLLRDQDLLKEMKLRQLKSDIEEGLDDARNNRTSPLDTDAIKKEGQKRLAAKRRVA